VNVLGNNSQFINNKNCEIHNCIFKGGFYNNKNCQFTGVTFDPLVTILFQGNEKIVVSNVVFEKDDINPEDPVFFEFMINIKSVFDTLFFKNRTAYAYEGWRNILLALDSAQDLTPHLLNNYGVLSEKFIAVNTDTQRGMFTFNNMYLTGSNGVSTEIGEAVDGFRYNGINNRAYALAEGMLMLRKGDSEHRIFGKETQIGVFEHELQEKSGDIAHLDDI
jgi:hypothetical protein